MERWNTADAEQQRMVREAAGFCDARDEQLLWFAG
jgi:hypothetical protein